MAHYGSQMQGPPTSMCDYCGQKPKFPPYNYCGRVCGSKAKAAGNTQPPGPVMCKQCGQKPVFKNHEFCGRKCAGAWQAMQGQIHTSRSMPPQHTQQSWNMMPPPYAQNIQNPYSNPIQPPQYHNQGFGFNGPASQNRQLHPPQPIQQQFNPHYMQQFPGQASSGPLMISPPITPMSSGMDDPPSPGMYDLTPPTSPGMNQQYYSPSSPPGLGVQHFDASGQAHGQSRAMNMAMNPASGGAQPAHDDDSDLYADADEDQMATPNFEHSPNHFQGQGQNTGGSLPIQAQAQAHFSIQVTTPSTGPGGGQGNGDQNPTDPNHSSSNRSMSNASGSSATCRLNGCDKPVFVDPETNHRSEYCSQKHREEATISGQVSPCIMCLKMPRTQTDHFCSRACREKALSP